MSLGPQWSRAVSGVQQGGCLEMRERTIVGLRGSNERVSELGHVERHSWNAVMLSAGSLSQVGICALVEVVS